MTTPSSSSFERLHPTVQRWIWERNWTELRDAQERAIPAILNGERDLIISSATASGKTEAAFLPIASRLLQSDRQGLALYVSPLKALINDQWDRMEDLFGECDLPVYPWHGDISASKKAGFEKDLRGALLITPESLESILVRKGFYVGEMFRLLSVVVVDELHSFINTERGIQLASLLSRLEVLLGRTVQRIGLSATLGDMNIAAEFLRPGSGDHTEIIQSSAAGQELRLILKGYVEPRFDPAAVEEEQRDREPGVAALAIARDIFKALRGSKNLVFANSRRRVEEFTDRLIRLCEADRIPAEFYAHHGSLSKSLREDVEAILKEPDRPASAICTSTLEMGIDIGQVKSVSQLDPPFSVSSLRQRLGRSGRRGEPAILRMFVAESELVNTLLPQDSLRMDLFQAVAVTNLLLQKWCEPPPSARLHLSTLIQQVLSLIAQYGGLTAREAWQITCKAGPFRNVDPATFGVLLRGLAERDIIMQSEDGTLLHAPAGEQIVNHYSFYTAFWTSDEFQVVHGTSALGTLPVSYPVPISSLILFGGRRWRVTDLDDRAKVIVVTPAQGGRAPKFIGGRGSVHRRIHEEMHRLYQSSEVPGYLDRPAVELFEEGRQEFARLGLEKTSFISHEKDCLFFLWAGDRIANTLRVYLHSLGFAASSFGVGLQVEDIRPDGLKFRLREIAAVDPPDAETLAATVPNQILGKYDQFLPLDLLSRNYASAELDPQDTWSLLRQRTTQEA